MGEAFGRNLDTEIQYLKGVGPRVAKILAKLELFTVRDILHHLPRRYEDRTNLPPIGRVRPEQFVTIRGKLTHIESRATRGNLKITHAVIRDATGSLSLTWFNQPWIHRKLQQHQGDILVYGQVKETSHGYEITTPEMELVEEKDDHQDFGCIVPIYPLTEGITQKHLRRIIRHALETYLDLIEDPLPFPIQSHFQLRPLSWSLHQIHWPEKEAYRLEARKRLVFDEFFHLQLSLQIKRSQAQHQMGIAFPIDSRISSREPESTSLSGLQENLFSPSPSTLTIQEEIHKTIPFELTNAQKRVIQEIFADMKRAVPMNRLLQGDVGAGKTIVAACAMLAAVRCGYQAALMVPTEILAEQHYLNLLKLFEPLGIRVELLVGKLKAFQKRRIIDYTSSGVAHICVGTHALIQEETQFARLGLIVIDEQHRFGVLQRAALRNKSSENPDVLVMTATPIPRTLTMTLYGDLDLSVIDELPPGRKPTKTYWKLPHERPHVYRGVDKLLHEGRQAYFVCPMITESEKMQTQAAEDLYYRLSNLEFPHCKVGLLHGQMKPIEKEAVMEAFRKHEFDILVSTVVIEVGVDVPNASVMVIEDANRFGLSQLHQLRGRVGRGAHQSFCILIADAKTEEAQKRLEIMTQTNDGFKIAEEDLRLRGPGELAGTRQSGNLDLRIADLVQDGKMLEIARQAALQLLEQDPQLQATEHQLLLQKALHLSTEKALITIS
jgi:ATP-dependent DNA helicase RecG